MTAPFSPDALTTNALAAIVSELEAVEQTMRELDAQRVRLLAEAFDLAAVEGEEDGYPESHHLQGPRAELALRVVRSEIATALHMSERTVERQLSQAHALTWQYPPVLRALCDGQISIRHATVIAEAGRILGSHDDAYAVIRRGDYAEAVLEHAAESTPSALSAIARRLAERFAETPLDERHVDARRMRRVWVEARDDGMAELRAHLPAVEAYAVKDRLTRAARAIDEAECAADASTDRCRDEIRSDVLTDLLLNGEIPDAERNASAGTSTADVTGQTGDSGYAKTSTAGVTAEQFRTIVNPIRAIVQVVVPSSRLGKKSGSRSSADSSTSSESAPSIFTDTADLVGFGPIDDASAHRLAGDAIFWERIAVDSENGEVLGVNRYRPSEQMRRLLRARDIHCRFPGCRMPAHRCDIDHTVDAQYGGETRTDNLAHLCRSHHTLKHQSGWRVKQHPRGHLEWTSPSGRTHRTVPPWQHRSRVRFSDPPPEPGRSADQQRRSHESAHDHLPF